MKQHPVPQNIASYQFRLVGEMTLKQFLELAVGLIIAYFCFHLQIPYLIKWPIIVLAALAGFAFAFMPIQDRPLDQWITNFIKSIYAPTRYLWRKNNQPPAYLTEKSFKTSGESSMQSTLIKQRKLTEYLKSLPGQAQVIVQKPVTSLDQEEEKQLNQINSLLQNKAVVFKPTMPKPAPISSATKPAASMVEAAPALTPPLAVESRYQIKQKIKPEVVAMFSDQLAFPSLPQTPNVVVGMVVDVNNRILPNALVEIQNNQGVTVRAIKTNKLGQFFITNPLDAGDYKILTEHDNFDFDIINLKTKGEIISPIKIKAKKSIQ